MKLLERKRMEGRGGVVHAEMWRLLCEPCYPEPEGGMELCVNCGD